MAAHNSGNGVDTAALAALSTLDSAAYGAGMADIGSALGTALGFSGLIGTTAGGVDCVVGSAGCFNGIITITDDPGTPLYFRSGAQDPDSYDFFTVVEHEVDEVLGTSSCIGTTGGSLTNHCPGGAPSAVDLFRYLSPGNLVLLDTTPGAFFS